MPTAAADTRPRLAGRVKSGDGEENENARFVEAKYVNLNFWSQVSNSQDCLLRIWAGIFSNLTRNSLMILSPFIHSKCLTISVTIEGKMFNMETRSMETANSVM